MEIKKQNTVYPAQIEQDNNETVTYRKKKAVSYQ
ncbi:hypothetical protein SAMN05443252_107254 [Bacillus sp. OV322]|nr:hypothetical protein SAMN05443252_107254 [Bacillus sp. OV322]